MSKRVYGEDDELYDIARKTGVTTTTIIRNVSRILKALEGEIGEIIY